AVAGVVMRTSQPARSDTPRRTAHAVSALKFKHFHRGVERRETCTSRGPMYGGGRRGEEMRISTWFGGTLLALIALGAAPRAYGFCGCDKPPPPLANVRPFVGYPDQTITLFDARL